MAGRGETDREGPRGRNGGEGARDPEEARIAPLIDTNVIVRYLTGEPAELAARAARIVERSAALSVSTVVLAEAAHVLRSLYAYPREQIVDALTEFVLRENIRPLGLDRPTLVQALAFCRPSGRVSVADALLWAEARSSGANVVYSLDASFPDQGIEVRDRWA